MKSSCIIDVSCVSITHDMIQHKNIIKQFGLVVSQSSRVCIMNVLSMCSGHNTIYVTDYLVLLFVFLTKLLKDTPNIVQGSP